MKNFSGEIARPDFYLPSTSPAHASLRLEEKLIDGRPLNGFFRKKTTLNL